jgi:hypothetical protein
LWDFVGWRNLWRAALSLTEKFSVAVGPLAIDSTFRAYIVVEMTELLYTTAPEAISSEQLRPVLTQAQVLTQQHGTPIEAELGELGEPEGPEGHEYKTHINELEQLPPAVWLFFEANLAIDVTVTYDERSGRAGIHLTQSFPHGDGEKVNTADYDLSPGGLRTACSTLVDNSSGERIDNILDNDRAVISPGDGREVHHFMERLLPISELAPA